MQQLIGIVVAFIIALGLAAHTQGKIPHCIPRPMATPIGVSGGGPVGFVPHSAVNPAPRTPGD